MRRTVRFFAVVVLAAVTASAAVAGQSVRGFGFGGPMAMGFFPDMTGINTFLAENGLPPMGDVLIGFGGGGRGGVIGGPVFGGIGWGIAGTSEAGDRSAEFVFGGGGFDMGTAIGGDDSSVLTLGGVIGGGANVMTIDVYPEETGPSGLVIEPTIREFGRAIAFVQPYVSMAAQLLPWMGFEFRIGYVFPIFGVDFGDRAGIPAPSLNLSGVTVSFGLVFGGIGSVEPAVSRESEEWLAEPDEVTLSRGGSFEIGAAEEVVILNKVGTVEIESYGAEVEGTGAPPSVRWDATLTCNRRDIADFGVTTEVTGLSARLVTSGEGQADYRIQVPAGIDLKVTNGAGSVSLVGHEAQTITLENGAGDVTVDGVRALALFVTAGVGKITISDTEAAKLFADAGIGEIDLALDAATSAELSARTRLGDVSIDRFPGMIGGVRGFLGRRGDVTLAAGEGEIELSVGIGRIGVTMEP
jgi:hypothetical protein